ncbi:MAG: dolichyl-phosphate beta-glucosyltransferase [Clostridia bacterium]
MDVSLIIPAYNEEKRIIGTMEHILEFMNRHFHEYEVLVIDDGSTDNTVEVLKRYHDYPLRVFSQETNKGKGQAIKTGMLQAKGKYVFFTDADLPYPLSGMIEAIDIFSKTEAHLVLGSRDLYKERPSAPYPLHRRLMSKAFSIFINGILGLRIADTQCGFKGFHQNAVKTIFPLVTINGFGFDFEMLYIAKKQGLKMELIAVDLSHSEGSKVNIVSDSLKMMANAFKVRINDWRGYYESSDSYHYVEGK